MKTIKKSLVVLSFIFLSGRCHIPDDARDIPLPIPVVDDGVTEPKRAEAIADPTAIDYQAGQDEEEEFLTQAPFEGLGYPTDDDLLDRGLPVVPFEAADPIVDAKIDEPKNGRRDRDPPLGSKNEVADFSASQSSKDIEGEKIEIADDEIDPVVVVDRVIAEAVFVEDFDVVGDIADDLVSPGDAEIVEEARGPDCLHEPIVRAKDEEILSLKSKLKTLEEKNGELEQNLDYYVKHDSFVYKLIGGQMIEFVFVTVALFSIMKITDILLMVTNILEEVVIPIVRGGPVYNMQTKREVSIIF